VSQFIKITLSPTGKIFYRTDNNSFFWDYNKEHKVKVILGM